MANETDRLLNEGTQDEIDAQKAKLEQLEVKETVFAIFRRDEVNHSSSWQQPPPPR